MKFKRIQKLHQSNSCFLFGARGTGKSTLLENIVPHGDSTYWIDLLDPEVEEKFLRNPTELWDIYQTGRYKIFVIDEIQKTPKILDLVQKIIFDSNESIQFFLTGSSARKLKRNSANLLGGRAFDYRLFPLTVEELAEYFKLEDVLNFGSLPKTILSEHKADKIKYLETYVRVYIKEEVQLEQLVRNIAPFRKFLEVAAQQNGKIINYSKIAGDVGVDDKTVARHFEILEDTHLGFILPAYHKSVRKSQLESPKFYFFDTGVKRALDRTIRSPLVSGTYAYGEAFEHLVILEARRCNSYYDLGFEFYFLRTKNDLEIDLIVDRPGQPDLLVEIKSAEHIRHDHLRGLKSIVADWPGECEAQVWCRDPVEKNIDGIAVMSWEKGIEKLS